MARARIDDWARRKPDLVAPVFFVAKDLHGARVTLKKGEQFEVQDRRSIRLWAEAYGVKDGDTTPFHELPFVATVVAPCAEAANEIVTRGMTADEARRYVEGWLEANA
jgi:hypothetical protein